MVGLFSNFLCTVVLETLGDEAHHLHLDIHHKVQLLEHLLLSPHRYTTRLVVPPVLHVTFDQNVE